MDSNELKVLCIGDMHFKENNLRIMRLMCERILTLVAKTKPDVIVLLGDTLDRFAKVHTVPWKESIIFLEKLVAFGIPVYLLIGNHDYPNNSVYLSTDHPFYSLHKWGDIVVVDKVVSVTHKGYKLLLTPYVAKDRLIEACQSYSMLWYQEHDFHFGHSELQGCKMGPIKSNTTDVWKDFYCFTVEGHCHDYHILAPNAVFTGTPCQHSNADNHDKTISLYTVGPRKDKGESRYQILDKFHTIFYHKNLEIQEERIDLDLPKHKTIYLDYQGFMHWIPTAPNNGYDLLRVVVNGMPSEISTLKSMHYMAKLKERGINLALKEKHGLDRLVIEDVEKYSRVQKPKFSELLYSTVKDDPDMLEIYKKVCITTSSVPSTSIPFIPSFTPVPSTPVSTLVSTPSVVLLED